MKVIEISNKVHLVRHWLRWYRVQRGAAQWQPLSPTIKNGRPPKQVDAIDQAVRSLKEDYPTEKPPLSLDK